MADSSKPLVWKAFDAAERAVTPRVETVVRSETFLDALGLATRAQAGVRRQLEARTRGVWHLMNLPAGSDVARLRKQVAQLDRQLRQVNDTLDRALAERDREEVSDAHDPVDGRRAARAGRAAGSRPPGRRAQRPARP